MARVSFATCVVLCVIAARVSADGPNDNRAERVRPIPPPGITLLESDRTELQHGLAELDGAIKSISEQTKNRAALVDLLPDVQVYAKAVRYALENGEFFHAREIPVARQLLKQGLERARQLGQGQAPWTRATGLVVRGYRSRIDDSIQPYGLVVPASYQPGSAHRHRLDFWFHGRGETLSEVNFINDRQKNTGEFAPRDTFVLHLYGRYCNANKLAGEVDLFEALEHAQKHYPIDMNRLAVRGFSMGGAACWQFAVHYAGLWAAAAPGAGFAETPEFLRIFQAEKVQPTWYEKKLWHLYDCTDYAVNLYHCPTVAYSGEIDKQKQAADIMAGAMAKEGLSLVHLIGPKTGHAYHHALKPQIESRLESIMTRGRDLLPAHVRFTTWTLRYNQMHWVQVDGLEEHWERARVNADIVDDSTVTVKTANVSALTLRMPPGLCPLDNLKPPFVLLDGKGIQAANVLSDRSWTAHFRKVSGVWMAIDRETDGRLRKRHGLQGPIDDAFMEPFLMVRPTLKGNAATDKWTADELNRALVQWRRQFRGDAPVKNDDEVTDADIASKNLILWGTPLSNKILAKIVEDLPLSYGAEKFSVGRYGAEKLSAGPVAVAAAHHMPIMIYPNPLNPKRYVVLNSGFTFREYDNLNNARQVPKLPDWAIVDIRVPPNSRTPGKIVDAGFFGENW